MIIPCGHRIVIKQQKLEDVDEAYKRAKAVGIHLVDTDSQKRAEKSVDMGIVVAIGPTAFDVYGGKEAWCAVGDLVAFARNAGKFLNDVETNDEYLVMNDDDIVAILKKGDK